MEDGEKTIDKSKLNQKRGYDQSKAMKKMFINIT